VPTLIVGTRDRLVANVLVAHARRRWPMPGLVPARWLHPLLLPTARRLRISLARAAIFTSLAVITTAAALVLPR
jgi:hypothetical protein